MRIMNWGQMVGEWDDAADIAAVNAEGLERGDVSIFDSLVVPSRYDTFLLLPSLK